MAWDGYEAREAFPARASQPGAYLVASRAVPPRPKGSTTRHWRSTTGRSTARSGRLRWSPITRRRCCGGWRCWGAACRGDGKRSRRYRRGHADGRCRSIPRHARGDGGTGVQTVAGAGSPPCARPRRAAMSRACCIVVGVPLVEGLMAFWRGAHETAVARLLPVRFDPTAYRRQPRTARRC